MLQAMRQLRRAAASALRIQAPQPPHSPMLALAGWLMMGVCSGGAAAAGAAGVADGALAWTHAGAMAELASADGDPRAAALAG